MFVSSIALAAIWLAARCLGQDLSSRLDEELNHFVVDNDTPDSWLVQPKKRNHCLHRHGLGSHASCQVFLLDLSDMASALGLPRCSEAEVVVDPSSGSLLPKPPADILPTANQSTDAYPFTFLTHNESIWAGPWFMKNTFTSSNMVTDLDKADLVVIYDYCYLMSAQSQHNARKHWLWANTTMPEPTPGQILLHLYRAVLSTQKWQEGGGRDFAFWHAHPGHQLGDAALTKAFKNMVCNDLQWSTFFISEHAQRWSCPSYNPTTSLVVPYASVDIAHLPPQPKRGPEQIMADGRTNLLYYRGKCHSSLSGNVGRVMRRVIVTSLLKASGEEGDLDLCCTGKGAPTKVSCTAQQGGVSGGNRTEQLLAMRRSRFALVLPSTSQSTRDLTDAVLSGCIPVFLGPPYAALPFSDQIDWAALGLVYNIKNGGQRLPWWPTKEGPLHTNHLPAQHSKLSGVSWWFPEVHAVADLPSMEALLPSLRAMSASEVAQKYEALLLYQPLLRFVGEGARATEEIAGLLCSHAILGEKRFRGVTQPTVPEGL